MNLTTTFKFKLFTFNLHRELRFALLAAMETCWVYGLIVFAASLLSKPPPLTPLPFFLGYWVALVVGRALPESKLRWVVLQILAIAIAIVTLLVVARAELYPDFDWYDLTWLPRLIANLLAFTRRFAIEHIVSIGALYVFIRGLSLAQRPLTLWFIGFQFRLGIIIWFTLLAITGAALTFDPNYHLAFDASTWVFIYFFISLLAIALARMDEMGRDVRYGPRWAVTLVAAVALVLFIGLGVLQIFTLDTARAMVLLLTPLGWVATAILFLFAVPLGLVAEWLITLFRPVLDAISKAFSQIADLFPTTTENPLEQIEQSVTQITWLEPLFKTIVVLVIVLIVGIWLARALNRRMRKIEAETYTREAIDAEDDAERVHRAGMPKKPRTHTRAHAIAAESIRRIYAALVAHVANVGMPRAAAETPYEFLPRLTQQWQTESADLRVITEAYVQVHYAERDATQEQVRQVREAWARVEKNVKRKT